MAYKERTALYEQLQTIRKNPLIAYVTSIRPGCSAQMEQDVLPFFIEQIRTMESGGNVDVLILSNGGDPIVSWRIISLLREKFKKITVMIPYTAYSAATLLALGADEIIMHPFGNLGPLDPQLTFADGDGKRKTISYEDITKYLEFVKDSGISDQELLEKAFDRLSAEIPPTALGFAKRSSQLGLTMSQKLLATHMRDENKTKAIAETLNSKFYHHGYPLSRREAKEIGLQLAKPNEKVESLLWNIYEDLNREMQFSDPLDPRTMILEQIKTAGPLSPNQIGMAEQDYLIVSLESARMGFQRKEKLVAYYSVSPDASLNTNIMLYPGQWCKIETKDNSKHVK